MLSILNSRSQTAVSEISLFTFSRLDNPNTSSDCRCAGLRECGHRGRGRHLQAAGGDPPHGIPQVRPPRQLRHGLQPPGRLQHCGAGEMMPPP